jgi:hypothetical protein
MLNSNNNKMKKISIVLICTMFAITNIFAQGVKADLDKSLKSGKSTYMIVFDKAATGTDVIIKTTEEARKKVKNTNIVKLDRDDKANADLVSKYRLAGATLPLVLTIAPNGAVAGGLAASDVTTDKLISSLPSKNQADVLLGFENGKAAFVICGKKNAKDKTALITECNSAITSLGNKANQVFVDLDSKEETNFITLLNPDKTKTSVLVFNGKGQYTGTFEASVKSDELVKSVNKKIGGCCPGGSGSGCGKK